MACSVIGRLIPTSVIKPITPEVRRWPANPVSGMPGKTPSIASSQRMPFLRRIGAVATPFRLGFHALTVSLRVRHADTGEHPRSAQTGSKRRVPGTACQKGIHTQGCVRVQCVPCGTDQLPCNWGISLPRGGDMVEVVATTKPKVKPDVGTHDKTGRRLAPHSKNP